MASSVDGCATITNDNNKMSGGNNKIIKKSPLSPNSESFINSPKNNSLSSPKPANKKKKPLVHLVAGGSAGFVEASICHPLDTIKTRMQLRRTETAVDIARKLSSIAEPMSNPISSKETATASSIMKNKSSWSEQNPISQPKKPGTVSAPLGPLGTSLRIVQREGFSSLYKGLTTVLTGIIPKMAIRFLSFEAYREYITSLTWYPGPVTFSAGLLTGITEAILVVTPVEVCKIRMQSQFHSMTDASQMARRKYRNFVQTAILISKEEGTRALYKGVVPTMIRQAINQGVNFTCYNFGKSWWINHNDGQQLQSWQTMIIGGISGGFGPTVNNPLDVVKTRMQKQVIHPNHPPKYSGVIQSCFVISKEEGWKALYKGLTPRLMRIIPGQAITFMVYEAASSKLVNVEFFQ